MDIETKLKIERALQTWDFEPNNLPTELDNLEINANEFLRILTDHYLHENELGRNFWRPRNYVSEVDDDDGLTVDWETILENKAKRYKILRQHYKEYRKKVNQLKKSKH